MKALYEQQPKLRWFRPRETLTKIHLDLFKVHSRVETILAYYPPELTILEKLCLVLEDRRFFDHHGIDFVSVARETMRAITLRKHGGASTIDMQFVRTATGYKELTVSRKLYEMFVATIIQFRYSKIIILRSYLACAYFGWRLRGANAVSKKLFQKRADQMSLDEAAAIAAMLVYPHPRFPTADWQSKVKRRADYGKRIYIAHKQRFDQMPG